MAETPMARAMVACEQIIIDSRTKNVTAVHCFLGMGVARFPSDPQKFSIYATLTNGLGPCTMKVEVALLEGDSVIYSRSVPLDFPNPLTDIRFTFRVRSCVFPKAGKYCV